MKRLATLLFFIVIGAFLTQGFQCASPEMTTAKLAMKHHDWEKAETFLEKEIIKNKSNGEAWLMLAEVQLEQRKVEKAAKSIKKGIPNIKDPNILIKAKNLKYKLWYDAFDAGLTHYHKYFDTQDKEELQKAIENIELAARIKPNKFRNFQRLGAIYELKGDTTKAIKAYEDYSKLVEKNIEFAIDKGIFLGMGRKDALKTIGSPKSSYGKRYDPAADSIIIDEYKFNEKDIYIYSSESKGGTFQIFGWKVNPPQDWLQNEREQEVEIYLSPFADLAQIYFDRQEYEKSLENVMKIIKLDPNNVDANNFMVSIYVLLDKEDEATAFIDGLVKKTPNNKYYRAQYGDILLRINKYDDAIHQYEKAIELDPNYVDVLRNLAAAYKNKAVVIQKEQKNKYDNDPTYNPDLDEYFPFLEKSLGYFESVKKDPKYSRNIELIGELINLYEVLELTDKFKMSLAELEAYENIVPNEEKEDYYIILLKIYDRTKEPEKLEKVKKKLKLFNSIN